MRRIQAKITLTYILLMGLAVAGFTLAAGLAIQSSLRDQKTAELSARIDVIAPLLQPRHGESPADVHRHIRDLASAMNLRITLMDSAGTVLVDSDVPLDKLGSVENHLHRPEVQEALRNGIGSHSRLSGTVGREFLYVAKVASVPAASGILSGVRCIRLSEHLEEVRTIATAAQTNILLAGVLALLFVAAVSVIVSRRIATPMVEIANAVEQIRAGNLDTRVAIRSNDEVGRVAQAVNEMAAKLRADLARLTKLERVRSEFLGNVSHELRTPIFSLQGFLETLLDGAIDDPAVNRDFVRKAYEHSVRLNTLLGDLITISQIESGEMKMSFRYFNLGELVAGVLEAFRPLAEHNTVRLFLAEDSATQVEVLGDKERLRVVFENLLENAIKYNKPGGEVSVSLKKRDGSVEVRVADTGVGIPAEHLPRIFERFYRVDKGRSREVGGTGLGLAIVKHIVEAHGSMVQVESSVEKGSVFRFTLKTES